MADLPSGGFVFLVAALLSLAEDAIAGEFCYRYYHTGHSMYCRYGCCGPKLDRHCCSLSVGIIAGGVIGGIGVICLLVAAVCCCLKKQTFRGRVVTPHQAGTTVMVHASASAPSYPGPATHPSAPYPPPPHPYPHPYPQSYPLHYPGPKGGPTPGPPPGPPPPPYAYSDPAYPPPPAYGGAAGPVAGFAAPQAPAYPPNY